jgi:hypothetical protein
MAPEIITPPRRGNDKPAMESKAGDVFAFGMFAVEVFTGRIPFQEQMNEEAMLRISQGGRPQMPENAHEVGLTNDMWVLLESCWQQNPRKRPSMGEVVGRWRVFVESSDGDSTTECVQIIPMIPTASLAPSSTLMIDLGTHPRRNPYLDNGRGPPPFDPERNPTLSNPSSSLKPSDSERIPRQFGQLRCSSSSNWEQNQRSPGSRLSSEVQDARLSNRA